MPLRRERAHHAGHRAQALNGAEGGQDRSYGAGAAGGVREPRGAAAAAGRRVQPAGQLATALLL